MKKVLFAIASVFAAVPALAQEAATTAAVATTTAAATTAGLVGAQVGWVTIGVGLMMGLAVLGGTLGQSRAASAALDGIARNPAAADKFQNPLILSLALMESLVLFAFLIGILLQGKIGDALASVIAR